MAGDGSLGGERSGLPQRLRVAAYAVCRRDGQVLLARWVLDDETRLWTLPGGGLDHGEDPLDGMVREVREETGYQVVGERLLGIDSRHSAAMLSSGTEADLHALRVIYRARVVGGELQHEVGGSTDQAAWFDLEAVPGLDRVGLVDLALALDRQPPATGRPAG